jgi:hypothetical protein
LPSCFCFIYARNVSNSSLLTDRIEKGRLQTFPKKCPSIDRIRKIKLSKNLKFAFSLL